MRWPAEEFRDGLLSMDVDLTEVQILRMFKAVAGPNDNEIDM